MAHSRYVVKAIYSGFFFFFSGFPFCLTASLDQAERLFKEGSYLEASPLYEELLQTPSDNDSLLRLRLASCYLELNEDQKVIQVLENGFSQLYENERRYLLALAYRHTGQYAQALKLLQDEHPLELGLNHFYLNQEAQARLYLQSITPDDASAYPLAQLYLARLELKAQNPSQALYLLNHLEYDPLRFEMAYLKGQAFFMLQEYPQAIAYFKQSLPEKGTCEWRLDALYSLAISYLKQADATSFASAEEVLYQALAETKEERFYLALGQLYTAQARVLKDEKVQQKAREILSQTSLFPSQEGQQQALLLLPLTAFTYKERDALFEQLIQTDPSSADAWMAKGMNAFEAKEFATAAKAFEKAFSLNPTKEAHRYQALSYYHQQQFEQAWNIFKELLEQEKSAELLYLTALTGYSLLEEQEEIFSLLDQAYQLSPASQWGELSLKLKGTLYFQNQDFEKADLVFAQLTSPTYQDEALFWRAKCAENLGQTDRMRELLREIYEKDPKSPYAPRAYLSCYAYRDYMQGDRKAIKHLQAMPSLFPNEPLTILAHYLIGLDYKKDHLSIEGKVQSHQNLIAAIEAFLKAEILFDAQHALIPNEELTYFNELRDRAHLERALANLAIAEHSQGAKKQIFLEYSEEVLQQIKDRFPFSNSLYPEVLEESDFQLAKVYLMRGKEKEADALFDQMLARYRLANISQRPILSHVWVEKGRRAQAQHQYAQALAAYNQAEASALGLTPDQKLDIWIQQSLCHRDLGQFEESMRLLSKVVNDEAISGLRIKAMYLRAELYERQGKPELALKQLEATSKKGGEWGQKAREKLNKEDGYE